MAEIAGAAAGVTSTVLELGKILYNEADFLLGVKDGVEQLEKELRWMKSFLNDAETKLDNNNNLIREWVSDVRDLSYEAEDIIDTFLHKFRSESDTSTCWHCISFTKNVPTTHKLGRQLEKLKAKSDEIEKRRSRYGLNADVSKSRRSDKLKERRASASYANNEYMVGLAGTVSILKDKLTAEGCGRSVISILGMGGLGKTTLARKLYTELGGPGHFDYTAWVCVSQEYNTEDILNQVIKSMKIPNDTGVFANKRSMEEHLRDKLAQNSYLVVIDDVWEVEAWESFERAFPSDTTKKGRVIITTRNRHVAELNPQHVYKLPFLDENESWELFCKETFKFDTNKECPSNLEQLGKEMVGKCLGLPLALKTLGGILSTKSKIQWEWQLVRDNLWKQLEKSKDSFHIDAVLTLSFKELPDYLKLCFLYVGMFPEDFWIPIQKLKLLWEAEGFLIGCEEQEEASTEDIAQSCFNELVGRNLLQITGEEWIGSTCRVHDLLRDLAIRQAKDIRFCAFYGESQKNDLLKVPSGRRLAMHLSIHNMPGDFGDQSLRTLCLDLRKEEDYGSGFSFSMNKLLKSLHQRFHLLRVLDIDIITNDRMPHLQVDKLFNLRYLSLKSIKPFELPESLGDLKELQTLYVSWFVILPKSVGKLQSLKHLLGEFRCIGGGIGKLAGLKTLEIADCKTWCDLDPAPFVNLRHLSLSFILLSQSQSGSIKETLVSKFASLKGLQKLVLANDCNSPICGTFEILEIFKHCQRITHFRISGSFICPDMHLYAANLQVLELRKVEFENFSSTISKLQRLPALRALRLSVYIDGRAIAPVVHFACSEVGFPQLRTLHIDIVHGKQLGAHVVLSVAEGGLPVLTNLHVNKPDKLIAPDRLKQLISVAP